MRVPCRQWSVAAYRALLVSRREELCLPRHRLSVCKRSESQGGRRSYPCAAEPQPSSGIGRDKASPARVRVLGSCLKGTRLVLRGSLPRLFREQLLRVSRHAATRSS